METVKYIVYLTILVRCIVADDEPLASEGMEIYI
jgi:hypothetical protein